VQLRIGLKHGRANRVAAPQRPAAVVDPQFDDPPVGLLVGDHQDRKAHSSVLALEVDDHLREAAMVRDDVLDVLDRGVLLLEPGLGCGHVCLERPRAPDAPAYGMVQLGLAGKRPDQGIEVTRQQPVEEGHRDELALPLLLGLLERRRSEQLREPRHAPKRPTSRARSMRSPLRT
jgi:hypothetical protein